MHVDFLTLACLRDDLVALAGGRVQEVVQTSERAVALELYAGYRTTLLLDTNPRHARALLQEGKARRGLEAATPLGLLLRKYVRGARLRGVTQPAWERVLEFEFEGEEGRSFLVAEIMGRSSNLLLLDERRVIRDCIVRVGAERNAYRVTLPNHPYIPPPPISKRPPTSLGPGEWERLLGLADRAQPLYRALLKELAGVSPTVAREIAARATGEPEGAVDAAAASALHSVTSELFAPLKGGEWAPHVAVNERGETVAFAPYRLVQYPASRPAASISAAMEEYFASRLDTDSYAAARQRVSRMVEEARRRVESTLFQLRSQLVEPSELERLRENGELLLAYQWQVQPGMAEVEVYDYEGLPRRIALDPTRGAVDNAQRYFERYQKKKRAADEVPPRLRAAEQDLAFLAQLSSDLALAEERPEIDAVRDALISKGLAPSKARKRGAGSLVRGPRRVQIGEWSALVGRNSQQNDEVTFRHAAPDDLWLHARGVPGSHVILKSAGREIPEEVVRAAASLAAYYSQARGSQEAAVDVTERRHVRRISGARPGLVTYQNERTLHVAPRPAEQVEEGE